ncbi:DUF551 domain-containing protein [Shigella sonnei]|uniref:DUF551 domain-containing protein n=4 Tax=Escherichia coli TaxID=562 RepID=A0A0E0Y0L4_ECO1C|nr:MULTISPECIES: DUF551 domain-containing protein [Enterobacteriaceae]EEZ8897028.1 DUF551 domain-containing protein [Escherichia coli O104]EFN8702837.1 DUF551 domain-containing protein [Escherichia coli O79]EFP6925736.1 DUF551 domain-containing protein [Shigella dysenteriae]EGR70939.1 hypothetical protein HUSEC_28262 [Escherichia coli O104:H4 str. LB226692]EHQ5578091.1 DUF551 domain-containing protein [Escherichia coli O2]EHV62752.1 hypothetical protein ECDEC6C_1817 [Escherichia coli DEC6C]E
MTTFTKEQLISHVSENVKAMKFAVKQTAFKNSLEAIELDLALALVAQASLEAEPVLYMNRFTGKTFSLEEQPGADKEPEIYVPLYAAPPDSAAMLQAGNFREKKGSSTNNFREISETSTNHPVTLDGWISCSERMPDDGQHVIILCDGAFVLYAQYRDGEFFDVVRDGDEFFETQSRNVTDWMPLPEPPQEVRQ